MSRLAAAERILSALLSVATVAGVAVLLEGRINAAPANTGSRVEQLDDWEQISRSSVATVTANEGAIDVVTFTDFECPMCKIADSVVSAVIRDQGLVVNRRIVSFPLPAHANAMAAALAFECSADQGRAAQMYENLYASTHLFASSPWLQLARSASVPDSARFAHCMGSEDSRERIRAGLTLGKRLRISGTPAFVINGTLYDAAPLEVVEKALLDAAGGSSTTRP